MSKSHIIYKDVAPGAASDAIAVSTGANPDSDLQVTASRAEYAYIALEHNRWLLDGSFRGLGDRTVSFWSAEVSGGDGRFSANPSIEILFDEQYSSVGLTVTFDTEGEDYCSGIMVEWYRDDTLLSGKDFSPDSTLYFCENHVVGWNRIVLTIIETHLPNRRAKINSIAFGVIRRFDMKDLRNVDIVNEMDVSAIEIPVSSMRWSIDTRDTLAMMFQLKQPVECWNDDHLLGVYYIDSNRRDGVGKYSIECYDALGVLDESPFSGGVYSGKSAMALLLEIVDSDFAIAFEVEDKNLTGAILPCTKREAVQQVLFAAGWCVSTDGREDIRVFTPPEEACTISADRTFSGTQVDTGAIVTEVVVQAHSYSEDANGSVEINGTKYNDTVTKYSVTNPNTTANDKKNVKEISGATLISPDIGNAVAQRVYDYYNRRNTMTTRFVWRGERLGDCVTQPTPWNTQESGNIQRLEIKLSNTIVASGLTLGV